MPEPIQTLVQRLAEGDRSAIEPAFAILWPLLKRFAARALRNEADAEDVAQQAIEKLFAQVASFDPSRDALGWVLSIARFECRTVSRKRERRRETNANSESMAADGTPETKMLEADLALAVREVLAGMNEADANVILLALSEDRPRGDATFRKRLQRAMSRLRLLWRAEHGTE